MLASKAAAATATVRLSVSVLSSSSSSSTSASGLLLRSISSNSSTKTTLATAPIRIAAAAVAHFQPTAVHRSRRQFSHDGGNGRGSGGGGGSNIIGGSNSSFTPKIQEPRDGEHAHVHPLSQIVLERLQENRSFLIRTGLDQGLNLYQDGTFVLRFHGANGNDNNNKKSNNEEEEDIEYDRIWTSYDATERKHWLSVKKGKLVGRFLLQDNMKPAWHASRLSTHEKVKVAVDDMIEKIEMELK